MSTKKERNIEVATNLIENKRDIDIHTLSVISSKINTIPGMHFILTGSYAIEALTGKQLDHNDMDVNVFTGTDLAQSLPRVATIIKDETQGRYISFHRKTNDRLEYDVVADPEQVAPRRLELQFVRVTNVSEGCFIEFYLENMGRNSVRVPTVLAPLYDSKRKKSIFRVKSLPYAIATWAIRISEFVQNPKRPIRDSDLGHLKLLLAKGYQYNEVILAMKHHPQMPQNVTEDQIFTQALAILDRE